MSVNVRYEVWMLMYPPPLPHPRILMCSPSLPQNVDVSTLSLCPPECRCVHTLPQNADVFTLPSPLRMLMHSTPPPPRVDVFTLCAHTLPQNVVVFTLSLCPPEYRCVHPPPPMLMRSPPPPVNVFTLYPRMSMCSHSRSVPQNVDVFTLSLSPPE